MKNFRRSWSIACIVIDLISALALFLLACLMLFDFKIQPAYLRLGSFFGLFYGAHMVLSDAREKRGRL